MKMISTYNIEVEVKCIHTEVFRAAEEVELRRLMTLQREYSRPTATSVPLFLMSIDRTKVCLCYLYSEVERGSQS